METILSGKSVSVTELKRNPNAAISAVEEDAVAVLVHNKLSAYLLSVEAYEQLLECIEDLELAEIGVVAVQMIAVTRRINIDDVGIASGGFRLLGFMVVADQLGDASLAVAPDFLHSPQALVHAVGRLAPPGQKTHLVAPAHRPAGRNVSTFFRHSHEIFLHNMLHIWCMDKIVLWLSLRWIA